MPLPGSSLLLAATPRFAHIEAGMMTPSETETDWYLLRAPAQPTVATTKASQNAFRTDKVASRSSFIEHVP